MMMVNLNWSLAHASPLIERPYIHWLQYLQALPVVGHAANDISAWAFYTWPLMRVNMLAIKFAGKQWPETAPWFRARTKMMRAKNDEKHRWASWHNQKNTDQTSYSKPWKVRPVPRWASLQRWILDFGDRFSTRFFFWVSTTYITGVKRAFSFLVLHLFAASRHSFTLSVWDGECWSVLVFFWFSSTNLLFFLISIVSIYIKWKLYIYIYISILDYAGGSLLIKMVVY